MGSSRAKRALAALGREVHGAGLRRAIVVADLATRAGASASSVTRLEREDPGVGLGTLADVLVALGVVDRLADLIDVRKGDPGLALTVELQPRRGRSSNSWPRRRWAIRARSPSLIRIASIQTTP